MSSVTQKIPNYVAGISEQPDELKFPGQVRDMNNCFPDVTRQLIKRPGSRFVTNTVNEENNEWFSYYRDETEQYIGCVRRNDGLVTIYNALTGETPSVTRSYDPIPYGAPPPTSSGPSVMTNPNEYLIFQADESIQFLSVNDFTFVTNREKFPRMLPEGTDKSTRTVEAYASYTTGPAGTVADVATANIVGTGTGLTVNLTVTGNIITAIEIATPGNGYKNGDRMSITGYPNAAIVYLDDAKSPPAIPEAYVEVKVLAYGRTYEFNVLNNSGAAIVTPTQTTEAVPTNPLDVGTIIAKWQTDLRAAGFSTSIIGNGIYFTRGADFGINVLDTQAMNGFAANVNTFERLPYQCHDGMLVRVVNSDQADEDDFYVVFNGDEGNDGVGVWEETVAPDLFVRFDADTMPHQIVRNEDLTFTVSPIDWGEMLSGNYETNPPPAFIDKDDPTRALPANEVSKLPINKLLLFRNRLVFLSQENVSTSQAGAFFDLFSDSVISITPIDPIQVAASSNQPAILYDGLEINNGLVLFGETQQYLLTSEDSAVGLSQETVKLSSIANFLYDKEIRPVMMGTTVAFTNMAGTSFRLFEMARIDLQGQPITNELSKIVSQLLPQDLTSFADSKEGNLFLFANGDANRMNEIWGFRYYTVGEERKQQAWFRWTLPGTVLYHTIMRDTYFYVCRINGQNKIIESDLKRTTQSNLSYGKYLVHMDNQEEIKVGTAPGLSNTSYDPVTDTTSFDVNAFTGDTTDPQVYAYNLQDGDYKEVTIDYDSTPNRGTVDGNWNNNNFIVGYLFDMSVSIPRFYRVDARAGDNVAVKSDTRASLVIHRFNVEAGTSGVFQTTLRRQGYPDYTETYYPNVMDAYKADAPMIEESFTRTVPCYIRNKQMEIDLHSKHPTPFTLFSISWEGDFSNKYYRSV